jgi:type II secretory pathway pseudopilin PulG
MNQKSTNWPVTIGLAIAIGLATLVILKNSLRMSSDRENYKILIDLKAIKSAVEQYKHTYGTYPAQQKNYHLNFAEQFAETLPSADAKEPRKMFINFEKMAINTSHPNYAAPNADPVTLLDPWSLPYLYRTTGKEFTIWSSGVDKVNANSAGDDISIDAVDKQAILDKRKEKKKN